MTAQIITFGSRTQKPSTATQSSPSPVTLEPVEIKSDGETPFDDNGTPLMTERTDAFLNDLALLIQEYEIDTGRLVSANMVVHSNDFNQYATYAYCRDADQEVAPNPNEYFDVAMMVPGLDMLDVLSAYPVPEDDDEAFEEAWEANQAEEEDGTPYNVWGGAIEYGLE